MLERKNSGFPNGSRLVARLQAAVSTAVKTPVVASIEYNYERDGEILIPAGTKAFGELQQANRQGIVSLRFHTLQMPDGTDWIEYMLNIDRKADQHLLGVMNHIAIGVPDVKVAGAQIEARGIKLAEQPKLGRDGKWQLNLYDPDDTRVELMNYLPSERPCCSEFTGTHPKP